LFLFCQKKAKLIPKVEFEVEVEVLIFFLQVRIKQSGCEAKKGERFDAS